MLVQKIIQTRFSFNTTRIAPIDPAVAIRVTTAVQPASHIVLGTVVSLQKIDTLAD